MSLLEEIKAYNQYTGEPHSIKIFKRNIENAAPYEVRLDDSFVATSETREQADVEVTDVILFFGFRASNPIFA